MSEKISRSLKSKIEKLLSLSESPNENEASLASKMVQDLLLKYNLSMSNFIEEAKSEYIEFDLDDTYKIWRALLLNTVADCNFCQIVIGNTPLGKRKMRIIGKQVNVSTVVSIYKYLLEAIKRISRQTMKYSVYPEIELKYGHLSKKKIDKIRYKYRNSFEIGLAQGLGMRLEEEKMKTMQEGLVSEKTCTALAVQNLHETEKTAIDNFLQENYNMKKPKKPNMFVDANALNRGILESNRISLNKQID